MKLLRQAERAIARVETYMAIAALSIMVAVAFGQIIMRTLFSQGFLWADVLLRQLVLWVGFLGASLATRRNAHIDVDVFTRMLPKKGKIISKFISNLIGAAVCIFLAEAALDFVRYEYELGESIRSLHLPIWVLQLILPFAFAMISVRFFIGALDRGGQLLRKTKGGERRQSRHQARLPKFGRGGL